MFFNSLLNDRRIIYFLRVSRARQPRTRVRTYLPTYLSAHVYTYLCVFNDSMAEQHAQDVHDFFPQKAFRAIQDDHIYVYIYLYTFA